MRECIRSDGSLAGPAASTDRQGNIRPGHRAAGGVEPAPKTPIGAACAVRVIIWQEIYRQYCTTDRPTDRPADGGTRIPPTSDEQGRSCRRLTAVARFGGGRARPGRRSVKTLPPRIPRNRPSICRFAVGGGYSWARPRGGSIRAANQGERTCADTTTLEPGHSRSTIVGLLRPHHASYRGLPVP